jgi:hypothetical protein
VVKTIYCSELYLLQLEFQHTAHLNSLLVMQFTKVPLIRGSSVYIFKKLVAQLDVVNLGAVSYGFPIRYTAAANGSFGSSPTGQRLMVATASAAGHQGTTYFQGQLRIHGGDKLGTSRGQAGALLGIVCQLMSLSSCGLQDRIW